MRKKKIVAETKAQNRKILKIPKRWHVGGNVLKRARGNQKRFECSLLYCQCHPPAASKSQQLAGILSHSPVQSCLLLGRYPRHWNVSPACWSSHVCLCSSRTTDGTAVKIERHWAGGEVLVKRSKLFLLSCSSVRSGLSMNRKGKQAIKLSKVEVKKKVLNSLLCTCLSHEHDLRTPKCGGLGGLARPFGIADLYILCAISKQVSEMVGNVIKEDSTRWFLPFFKTDRYPSPPTATPRIREFSLSLCHEKCFLYWQMRG